MSNTCMTMQLTHELFIITHSNRQNIFWVSYPETSRKTHIQITPPKADDQRDNRSQTALPSQTNHISVLLHITRCRLCLPTSVINLPLGTLLICQQPLFLLCNWDTPPGITGQDPTQHTIGQWGRSIRGSLSSVGRETHPPSCPPAITH